MATLQRFLRDPATHYFLFGPRGTGKSTWLGMVHPEALVLDLLAPDAERRYAARQERLRELAAGNPDAEKSFAANKARAEQHTFFSAKRRFLFV